MMLRRAINQIARAATPARGYGVRFATINGNQVRAGMALDIDGKIYRVGKNQHVKPGKGGAYVQAELKEIKTGAKMNRRFRAAETVNKAPLGPDEAFQFLYYNGDHLVIMHSGNFEQMEIERGLFSGRQLEFLQEGMSLSLQIIEGDVLWANMPEHVTLEVTKTTPKGVADTALSVKDATLENGAVIGNKVKVSTEDGAYVDKL
uniref:Translation elongation factor P/YeiP central domain-containing protein n=1 Tax=Phytophthora ramorum TaxID=164328 RepID=H3HBR2_PHYRM